MKKIILIVLLLVNLSVSLGGCLVAVEDRDRGGHRGEHREGHEERRY